MKSSIAAFVSAVSDYLNSNNKFKGSISLLITRDEDVTLLMELKKLSNTLKRKRKK